MQTAASQNSAIRPLGEEHLRMFRRTIGSQESAGSFRVVSGKPEPTRLSLSGEKVTSAEEGLELVARSYSDRYEMATLPQLAGNREFLESLGEITLIISSRDTPTTLGWYVFNPMIKLLRPTADDPFNSFRRFETYERIFIQAPTAEAARQGLPLILVLSGSDWHAYKNFGGAGFEARVALSAIGKKDTPSMQPDDR